MRVSEKYKEIFRLKEMLEKAKIPFDFYELEEDPRTILPDWEYWHINYPARGDLCKISVIEGIGSYGELEDLLEIMGGLTKEESEESDVAGYLTAENVFKRIEKDYFGGIKMKKVIRYVDEDTLEIIEKVVEENIENDDVNDTVALFEKALGDCNPEEFGKRYLAYKEAERAFNEVYEPFKANLIDLHKKHERMPKSVVIGKAKLTYVSPSTRTSIDSKKLKEEEPAIAEKYSKTTNVKASIRLSDEI